MSVVLEAIARGRALGEPQRLVDAVPYLRAMGVEMRLDDAGLLATMRFAPHVIGNPMLPAIHGGTLGALLETTAMFEVLFRGETEHLPKTINLTVEYLRSGRPQDTFARATVTKHGRRVVSVRSVAFQDDPDRPIAAATVQLLMSPAPTAGGGA